MDLIGIDGCKAGWLVARSSERGDSLSFAVTSHLHEIFDEAERGAALVVIDVPIGLPDCSHRECDRLARSYLGRPRSSSVFPAPCRATIGASNYEDARRLEFAARGKRISKQLYCILHKIQEVDVLISPQRQAAIREAHPEVTFAALSGASRGLAHKKKTEQGRHERLGLLAHYLPPFNPHEERDRLGPANMAQDDIVDAAACLATARRISHGAACVFPIGEVHRDGRGLRMEIVA